jgi:hypothetical protein
MSFQFPSRDPRFNAEVSPPLTFPIVGRKSRGCNIENCITRHYAKGFCKKHYTQVLRHGRLTPERERGVVRICKAAACNETDTIRYYCRKHARQIRVHGRLTPEREHNMNNDGCTVEGCREPHRAKGYCARHYNQQRWCKIKSQRIGQKNTLISRTALTSPVV